MWPHLQTQVLIYPMLDDRMMLLLLWNMDDNLTGWTKLLGQVVVGSDKVEAYAAPTRARLC